MNRELKAQVATAVALAVQTWEPRVHDSWSASDVYVRFDELQLALCLRSVGGGMTGRQSHLLTGFQVKRSWGRITSVDLSESIEMQLNVTAYVNEAFRKKSANAEAKKGEADRKALEQLLKLLGRP